jgi:CcmD family protein
MKSLVNSILLQVQHTSELADAQGSGKFYVVVAVIAVIFLGISGYMISVDRKLRKLEKNK